MKHSFWFGIILIMAPLAVFAIEENSSSVLEPPVGLDQYGLNLGQFWNSGNRDFVSTARSARRRSGSRGGGSGGKYSRDWEVGYAAHVNYYLGASTGNADIGFAPIHLHILQKSWSPIQPFGSNNSSRAMYFGGEVQYHRMTNSGGGQLGFTQFGPVLSQRFNDALGKSWFFLVRFRGGVSQNQFYAVNSASTRDVTKSGYASYVGAGIGIGLDLPPLRNFKLMYQPTFTFVGEGVVVINSLSLGLAVNF